MIKKRLYYYLNKNNKPIGPLSKIEFENLQLKEGTKIWHTGLDSWVDYASSKNKEPQTRLNKSLLYGVVGIFVLVFIIFLISNFYTNSKQKQRIMSEAYECEEFQMYLDKFYRDIEFFGINKRKPRTIIIKLAPMQYFDDTKDFHGVSFGYENDDIIEIYINEDSWKNFSRPQKYLLMYHELAHDILNVDDLPNKPENYGKLMCPFISNFDKITMDNFIEMSHELFEKESK